MFGHFTTLFMFISSSFHFVFLVFHLICFMEYTCLLAFCIFNYIVWADNTLATTGFHWLITVLKLFVCGLGELLHAVSPGADGDCRKKINSSWTHASNCFMCSTVHSWRTVFDIRVTVQKHWVWSQGRILRNDVSSSKELGYTLPNIFLWSGLFYLFSMDCSWM